MYRSKMLLELQSSYLKVVPKRYLPPPLLVFHTRNGNEWAKDDKDVTYYLSLCQNISLQKAFDLSSVYRHCSVS